MQQPKKLEATPLVEETQATDDSESTVDGPDPSDGAKPPEQPMAAGPNQLKGPSYVPELTSAAKSIRSLQEAVIPKGMRAILDQKFDFTSKYDFGMRNDFTGNLGALGRVAAGFDAAGRSHAGLGMSGLAADFLGEAQLRRFDPTASVRDLVPPDNFSRLRSIIEGFSGATGGLGAADQLNAAVKAMTVDVGGKGFARSFDLNNRLILRGLPFAYQEPWIDQIGRVTLPTISLLASSNRPVAILSPLDGDTEAASLSWARRKKDGEVRLVMAALLSEILDEEVQQVTIETRVFCSVCGDPIMSHETKVTWIGPRHAVKEIETLPFCLSCLERVETGAAGASEVLQEHGSFRPRLILCEGPGGEPAGKGILRRLVYREESEEDDG